MEWLIPLLQVGGTLAAGAFGANAANRAGDAQSAANDRATQAQLDMFNQTISLTAPQRATGDAARNAMAVWNGLPTQASPTVAPLAGGGYGGGYSSGSSSGGSAAPGQGQGMMPGLNFQQDTIGYLSPVAALFNNNPRASNSFDVFGTPEQNAGGGREGDFAAYMQANPDLQNWYNNLQTSDPRGYDHAVKSFDLNRNGRLDEAEAGQFHYQQHGRGENRTLPGFQAGGAGTGSTGSGAATGGAVTASGGITDMNSLSAAIQNNPFWKSAILDFAGVDGSGGTARAITGAMGAAGKGMSGSALRALKNESIAGSTNALSRIYGNYSDLADMGQGATNQQIGASNNVGNALSNAALRQGQIQSDRITSGYNNNMNTVNNLATVAGGWFNGG